MPSLSAMSKSRFIRQSDAADEPVLTIKGFELEKMQVNGRTEDKWILVFKETPRGLVLNQTHLHALRESFGPNDADCIGKRVQLFIDASVTYAGRVTGGTRLRAFTPMTKAKTKAIAGEQKPFDDDLP